MGQEAHTGYTDDRLGFCVVHRLALDLRSGSEAEAGLKLGGYTGEDGETKLAVTVNQSQSPRL
jgi:hypothetical protein